MIEKRRIIKLVVDYDDGNSDVYNFDSNFKVRVILRTERLL